MKTLYFDCFSGISGDMVIGALLDAGADQDVLQNELKKLGIEQEYALHMNKVIKKGLSATKFDVELSPAKSAPSSKLELQLHGHHHEDHAEYNHSHSHQHHEDHKQDHHHEGHHEHNHFHNHDHQHRHYQDIITMIQSSSLSEKVKETALNIFDQIGRAEAKMHQVPVETVHFHEVGAVDSIIDIVGAAILVHDLGIEKFESSPVPVGSGHIHIDHGIYPIPAPATLDILREVPLRQSDIKGELTTPTGAAIIKALCDEYGTIPSMTVQSVGYGAGTKDFAQHPNVLRVLIGRRK
ncbi:LarC family nickel insertion protein [Metabacillus herbersteinensis]|uniref:LarC family nickel insertion protein n=1 Tax=Metabacillus herbersteinensis TaxID=283816 RepID=A0ABV6GGP0_9BACI